MATVGAKRGEIWTLKFKNEERLAVIVSGNHRAESKLLSGIMLTDHAFDTNVGFFTRGGEKFANPNALTTINPANLIDYTRTASATEMAELDQKIIHALGLEEAVEEKTECKVDVSEPVDVAQEEEKTEDTQNPNRHIFTITKEEYLEMLADNLELHGRLKQANKYIEMLLAKLEAK